MELTRWNSMQSKIPKSGKFLHAFFCNDYIGGMPWISQSSVLKGSPIVFWESNQSKPRLMPSAPQGVSLSYAILGELKEGAVIEYSLVQGMFRLSWRGKVQNLNLEKGFEGVVEPCKEFSYFHSQHSVLEFGTKLLVRENLEFQSDLSGMQEAMAAAKVQHALEYRGAAEQSTQSMQTLGQNLA